MNRIVEEIKTHNRRYTIILVIIFILLIVGGCYYTLSIDNKGLVNNNINYKYSDISTSYQVITLTKEHKKYSINIDNNTDDTISYKVLLMEDKNTKNLCECSDRVFDMNNIRYSIDGNTKVLKNNIITEGILNKNNKIDIDISMWVESNDHFHGYFKIIK